MINCNDMTKENITDLEAGNYSQTNKSKKRRMEALIDIEVLEAPQKSPHDKKEYRVIKLQNDLTVLLISDLNSLKQGNFLSPAPVCGNEDSVEDEEEDEDDTEDEDMEEEEEEMMEDEKKEKKEKQTYLSAASLCIGVGHFENPREIQGLMHFLEHMVFMGSEKHPKENCFDNYIKKCGGNDNAHTDCENTTFYFDVQEMHFEKALDIFANFFISPLMKKDAMQRERKSVHSEFKDAIDNDEYRKEQLMATIANSDHPISFFNFGNEKTLQLDITDEELHSKLHQIRSKYYSAQYMTLAVQAREPLDKLQELVTSIFKEIPNNGLPKPSYERFGFPFSHERFHRLYKVIPVNDRHILELRWVMTPLYKKYYESKPLYYILHLIGHEGFGSIISYLKKRVWAVSIAAGNEDNGFDRNSSCEIFVIEIQLTDEGLLHVQEIIEVVFQYIRLLQNESPSLRIFSELQQVEQMEFDFAEEKASSDSVVDLSEEMQLYSSKHFLTGSYLLYKYDPSIIVDTLSNIRINNCNIMLSSKQFENENLTLQEEEWYGTKYCVEDIPQDWMEKWENAALNPELFLPSPNEFIPDNFEVYKWSDLNRDPPQYPQNIESNDRGTLWFKQDFKFGLPRAYCYIYCRLQDIGKSPEVAAMVDLFLNLFIQHVMEALYPAKLAQYETSIVAVDLGFILKINGFNQKLHKCLELILKQIEEFGSCLDDKTFNEMKQQQLKSYHNEILSPDSLRMDVRLLILQEVHWSVAEKMKALEKIEKDSFISEFLKEIFPKKYIDMLVQGNITDEEAKKLFHLAVGSSPLSNCKGNCPEMKVRKCKPGEFVSRVKSLNSASSNTSVINYYQGEKGSLKEELINEFIIMTMDEPVFDTLRTKDQLGYHVYCTNRDTYGVLGISITVNSQADKYSLSHINERIESFLKTFSENLKNISEDEMDCMKQTLKNFKLTVDVTLKDEVDRNWGEILSGGYMFDRNERKLPIIPTITLEEVMSYLQNLISPINNNNYRKLSVQVLGSSSPNRESLPCFENTLEKSVEEIIELMGPLEEDVKQGLSTDQFVSRLRHFVDQLPFIGNPDKDSD